MNTAELIANLHLLAAPMNAAETRADFNRLKSAYEIQKNNAIAHWSFWLADYYANDLSSEVQQLIYISAWEDGHAEGYAEVERLYDRLVDFTRRVQQA
jgi:hypothetical protein